MSVGLRVRSFGEQLGSDGKEGRVYEALCRRRFRSKVLDMSVHAPRGMRLAVKTFKPTKSFARMMREATFQQRAATVGVAPTVFGVNDEEKYLAMECGDALALDRYAGSRMPNSVQLMLCAYMHRLDCIGVLHNDGNARNVVMKGNRPWLIDFGFAKKLPARRSNRSTTMWMLARSFKRHGIDVPILFDFVEAEDPGDFIDAGESLL